MTDTNLALDYCSSLAFESKAEEEFQVFLENVAQKFSQNVEKDKQELAYGFVKVFYTNAAHEMLCRMQENDIYENLEKVWDFYCQWNGKEPKVRVYKWSPETGDAFAERIIIDIVNDNLSFGLDSLHGLLTRLGTKPRFTFHPIIHATRDEKGNITELSKPQNRNATENLESLVQIQVVENISDELIHTLEMEIPKVLMDVRRANEDWARMRQKAIESAKELESHKGKPSEPDALDEVVHFLNWIEDDHFTFLGYCNYDLLPNGAEKIASRVRGEQSLGVLKDQHLSDLNNLFAGISVNEHTKQYIFEKFPIIINKTSVMSNVHRNVRMDCINVRRFDDDGNVIGIHVFVGLFTSVAYDSSARDIPLLRTKISKIIDRAGFTFDWHDGKALIHILDSLPRDELFQASINELTDIALRVLRLQDHRRLAFFVRRDHFNRFLSCLVYIPRDRFDTDLCDRIADILSSEFEGTIDTYKAQYGEFSYARVHYTVRSAAGLKNHYDLGRIEALLVNESKSWADDLKFILSNHYHEAESASLYRKYKKAFDSGYQERYRGEDALEDILEIEELYKNGDFRVRIYGQNEATNGQSLEKLKLKLYHHGSPLPLSDVLPILENLDLKVISEVPYGVMATGEEDCIWIHDFQLESRSGQILNFDDTCRKFEDTLVRVRMGDVENDAFNRLVLRAGLTWRQCAIFRAYAKFIRLIGLPFSKAYLSSTLVRNPAVVEDLMQLFLAKFCPENYDDEKALKYCEDIKHKLDAVENADDDRVLRLFMTTLKATVRTNFFQKDDDDNLKDYMSFKISSRDIDEIPKPKPLFEIFVYSSDMEGVHLRGGKVARGGIRWSDRHEDFRTEVLNLVKAQMVKNTVIVPVGSKGGFIVKKSMAGLSREDQQKLGIACYKTFIKGLLDLTDNLHEGDVIHPKEVIRHDDDDTYLVVAADKGTATFSDFANQLSNDYGFWLGDAFASGGSYGYDHKKMGITAKGAWESVKRHFRERDKNIQKQDFTVIGVGDMSGDVFGNGMLLSKHICLQGAFNHLHIFVDPKPDAAKSYAERKRLFDLPRSSWSDYDTDCLSSGGRIYNRSDKSITLTPEIKKMLNCEETNVKPDHLIRMLLTHEAELIWFGGIGTYVKASTEGRNDVGDRANDNVRVDARDLKAKVIGEGANLGCTQLGRIEFERFCGGKINTDAIDNSAGVACSDREVNIKILFNRLMHNKTLTFEERNKILVKMTDDVSKLVLKDSYLQPQTITDIGCVGTKNFDQQVQLVRTLEQKGILDRNVENLPDDMTVEEYQNSQTAFSRPEFAVILGYAKIYYYDMILDTALPDDPFFASRLMDYFPSYIQEHYKDEIFTHPLRREIIATFAVNALINRMGPSFVNLAMLSTNAKIEDVFKAFFTVSEVFKARQLWDGLAKLDCEIDENKAIEYRLAIYKIIKRTILWLLRYYPMCDTIEETVKVLGVGIESFLNHMEETLHKAVKGKIKIETRVGQSDGLPEDLAHRLAILGVASTSPDIILIANETKFTVPEVAELYFLLGHNFYFSELRDVLDSPVFSANVWDRKLSTAMSEDLYNYQSDLTVNMLAYAEAENVPTDDHYNELIQYWQHAHRNSLDAMRHAMQEGQLESKPDLTVIGVILRDLRQFCGLN